MANYQYSDYSLNWSGVSRFLIENLCEIVFGNICFGSWKSLDPMMSKFPDVSPYNAFANNPIVFTDPNGLEPVNGDGDPPPGESVEGDGKNTVYVLPEVKAYGKKREPESTYKNKLDRITGKGNWSKESKEDRESYREAIFLTLLVKHF